jgi:hypothetical protein
MKDKHPTQSSLTTAELKLFEQLRAHPERMERFQSILEISDHADGPVKRADEIEALLIEEMRRLGNTTHGKLGQQGRNNFGRTVKAEGFDGCRTQKKR